MNEHEEPEVDPEAYAQGWRREFKEAVNAALIRDDIPVGGTAVIDYIEVKRLTTNPIHDYIVFFRP